MLYDRWKKNWKAALAENFFLRSAVLLLAVGLILNATVFRENTRIIVVPPTLTDQFWIEKGKAAPEYMEQMAVFLATLAGNLSPRNAEFNVDALLKYIDHGRMIEVKDDLSAQAEYIKKNNISQSFYVDATNVDMTNQSVIVEGQVVRNIGAIKVSQEKMRFHIGFKMSGYSLRVVDLFVDYPGRKKKEQEKDKQAAPPASVTGDTTGGTSPAEKTEKQKKAELEERLKKIQERRK